MGRYRRFLLIALAFLAIIPAMANPVEAPEHEGANAIKAGFVHQFTRFIHWPPREPPQEPKPFVIGVMGDSAMLAELEIIEQQKRQADGAPIEVQAIHELEAVRQSSILFIGSDAADQLDTILSRFGKRPLLIIGDTPGLAQRGASINFYYQRGRLRFEMNPDALQKSGLKAEAQLYDVAKIIQ